MNTQVFVNPDYNAFGKFLTIYLFILIYSVNTVYVREYKMKKHGEGEGRRLFFTIFLRTLYDKYGLKYLKHWVIINIICHQNRWRPSWTNSLVVWCSIIVCKHEVIDSKKYNFLHYFQFFFLFIILNHGISIVLFWVKAFDLMIMKFNVTI